MATHSHERTYLGSLVIKDVDVSASAYRYTADIAEDFVRLAVHCPDGDVRREAVDRVVGQRGVVYGHRAVRECVAGDSEVLVTAGGARCGED